MLSESELMQRVPVWNALSDLFLDTELSDTTHRSIAKVVTESGFEAQEIHDILWKEVLPAVGDNLRVVAGEWAGFDPEWLKERILSVRANASTTLSHVGLISVNDLVNITKEEWEKVCGYMPSDLAESLLKRCDVHLMTKELKPQKWWRFW